MTEDLFTHRQHYPDHPGYRDCDTSHDAAQSMADSAPLLRQRCLASLRQRGPASADQVAERLGVSILSTRPRFTELLRSGDIADTGDRAANRSGRRAKVWRAV